MSKKNRAQNWKVLLSYDERIRLHQILRLVQPKGTDGIKRNARALAAVEAGETFVAPLGMDEDAVEKLNKSLGEKRRAGETKLVQFHVTNADEILSSIDAFTKSPPKVAPDVFASETYAASLRYLEDTICRFEAVKNNQEIPDEVMKYEPEPEPTEQGEGDDASGNGQGEATSP